MASMVGTKALTLLHAANWLNVSSPDWPLQHNTARRQQHITSYGKCLQKHPASPASQNTGYVYIRGCHNLLLSRADGPEPCTGESLEPQGGKALLWCLSNLWCRYTCLVMGIHLFHHRHSSPFPHDSYDFSHLQIIIVLCVLHQSFSHVSKLSFNTIGTLLFPM